MYFDLEDYRPDIAPVGRAISWREGVLLSIIVHMALIILFLVAPRFLPDNRAARARAIALAEQRAQQDTQFVFVQPRLDTPAPRPPDRGPASDKDRMVRAPEHAPNPKNEMPFARGNTPERVQEPPAARARGEGPAPDPAAGQQARNDQAPEPPKIDSSAALKYNTPDQATRNNGANGRSAAAGGLLGDALKNLQRYVQTFDNQQGGGGQFGPEIQFDTKGVEFGPWVRRFVAQVKRNWLIPYSAYSMSGHVVITFNVHKDGSITDLTGVGPSAVDSFNNAAFGALSGSNPTQPLPPEYPADKAFFTVTFFYNETPR
jgi:outer membrane biosynthesis protein TonB